jgi:hypothetical protein
VSSFLSYVTQIVAGQELRVKVVFIAGKIIPGIPLVPLFVDDKELEYASIHNDAKR